MLARRDSTEQTHNSPRAIHYNTNNIQKCARLSKRSAEKNNTRTQLRAGQLQNTTKKRARLANIQNRHVTMAKTR